MTRPGEHVNFRDSASLLLFFGLLVAALICVVRAAPTDSPKVEEVGDDD